MTAEILALPARKISSLSPVQLEDERDYAGRLAERLTFAAALSGELETAICSAYEAADALKDVGQTAILREIARDMTERLKCIEQSTVYLLRILERELKRKERAQ